MKLFLLLTITCLFTVGNVTAQEKEVASPYKEEASTANKNTEKLLREKEDYVYKMKRYKNVVQANGTNTEIQIVPAQASTKVEEKRNDEFEERSREAFLARSRIYATEQLPKEKGNDNIEVIEEPMLELEEDDDVVEEVSE
jgi:hypothetical protein